MQKHENLEIEKPVIETPDEAADPTRMSEFAKTANAAKMSGSFHQNIGRMKRMFGEFSGDENLTNAGKNEEVMGKAHGLVGAIREVREAAEKKLIAKREEGKQLLRTHAGKLMDVAAEIARDLKKFIR